MPSIPVGATVPTFSRDFTQSLLGGTPANITRRCPDKVDSDSCGCDQDPYVRHECPFGGESCGCLRCPESFGPSFILHVGICYEACPADFRPAFFEAPPASTPVEDQPPSSTTYLSPTTVLTLADPSLVSTTCPVDGCYHGCVECMMVQVMISMRYRRGLCLVLSASGCVGMYGAAGCARARLYALCVCACSA